MPRAGALATGRVGRGAGDAAHVALKAFAAVASSISRVSGPCARTPTTTATRTFPWYDAVDGPQNHTRYGISIQKCVSRFVKGFVQPSVVECLKII